jgi:hypothetical protein
MVPKNDYLRIIIRICCSNIQHLAFVLIRGEQPSPRDAERRAMAIWYDTKQQIRCLPPDAKGLAQYPYRERRYTLRDGSATRRGSASTPTRASRLWSNKRARPR